VPGLVHGFTRRAQGIDVDAERAEVMLRLQASHEAARIDAGVGDLPLVTAEQVHGHSVAVVDAPVDRPIPDCDGLISSRRDLVLGIYVADCCAVYFAEKHGRAFGIVHSGRKGTEQGIVRAAIRRMRESFDVQPQDLIVQLSPCIRPPLYETDIAGEIVRQARGEGVQEIHDCGLNTGAELLRYYSYRVEKGRTGRMLAFAALRRNPDATPV
jgi:copper oxidase (laccase) domain-containing protein